MNMRMNWRLASRLSVITFAILVVIIVTLIQRGSIGTTKQNSVPATSSELSGTDLGNTPAPGFKLTDQYGKPVALEDFKGKPVVVTFLYTHCPDVCPLTAENLHATLLKLGSEAKNVGILAVSVDPKQDTVGEALKFSQAHNMQNYWHFLVGKREELSPVWSSYRIYAQEQTTNVNHSTALYIIDKQGRERIYLGDDFKPDQLASDLKVLLKE